VDCFQIFIDDVMISWRILVHILTSYNLSSRHRGWATCK